MRLNFSEKMPFDAKIETGFEKKILDGIKIHTLREDPNGRWKVGRVIDFVNGSRYKPNVFKRGGACLAVQEVVLTAIWNPFLFGYSIYISVDGRKLSLYESLQFIENDGFDNTRDFVNWFFPNAATGEKKLKIDSLDKFKLLKHGKISRKISAFQQNCFGGSRGKYRVRCDCIC